MLQAGFLFEFTTCPLLAIEKSAVLQDFCTGLTIHPMTSSQDNNTRALIMKVQFLLLLASMADMTVNLLDICLGTRK